MLSRNYQIMKIVVNGDYIKKRLQNCTASKWFITEFRFHSKNLSGLSCSFSF